MIGYLIAITIGLIAAMGFLMSRRTKARRELREALTRLEEKQAQLFELIELNFAERKEHSNLLLNAVFRREGKWVVAECLELGTSTFGRSYDEADKRLKEAILLHLQGLEGAGERERFFKEQGIKLYSEYPEEVQGKASPEIFHKAHVVNLEEALRRSSDN